MTEDNAPMILAMLYVLGCVLGMILRASGWLAKQTPGDATFRKWWIARLGSNLTAIVVGLLGTGLCVDGSLLRWSHLEGSAAAWALAAPFGAAITWGSHYILAWGKRKAEAAAGGPPAEGD